MPDPTPRLDALPALSDNYIWTLSGEAGAVIVDPGEAAPVLAAAAAGLRPLAVLLTHHHADHCGGVAALRAHWPELAVYAPHDERIANTSVRVADGEQIEVADWTFEVIAVPGHTLSHVAYRRRAAGGELFCGDTLFSLGCGRLFEGTPAQMLTSLDRLAALPDATPVCCGHEYTLANATFALAVEPGNVALRARAAQVRALRAEGRPSLPSTLAEEKACNPFLRVREPAVKAAVDAWLGEATADPVQTLAALRRWKDGFAA
ncbi:MAG: hydroxyacylglutathione hydrolase [Pseudoxanthomonas sp.]